MKLNLIQALRALAAYLVLIYHIRAIELGEITKAGTSESPLVGGPFVNGWIGVDLFFVISGFIMVYVTASKPWGISTARDFLVSRAVRIYPPWWLFMGLMGLYLFLAHGVPWDAEAVTRQENTPFVHVINSIFLLPQNSFPILAVGWTLVHEVWFYVVFAILLLAPRQTLPILLFVWALGVFFGALAGLSAPYVFNFTHLAFAPVTLEFIAGGFVAMLYLKGVRIFPLIMLFVGVISYLAVGWLHGNATMFTLEWGRVLYCTLPCAILVYGAACMEGRVQGPALTWMGRLGDWSFSLYLSHILVIGGVKVINPAIANRAEPLLGLPAGTLNFLRLGTPGILDNIVYVSVSVVAATLVSAIAFYLFERPVTGFLNRKFKPRPPKPDNVGLIETGSP